MKTRRIDRLLRSWLVPAVLLGSLATAGCGGQDEASTAVATDIAEQPFSLEFDASTQSLLQLEANGGSIWLQGRADTNVVRVDGVRRVSATSPDLAEAHLADIDLQSEAAGASLRLATKHPASSGQLSYAVDYEVTLPRTMLIELQNSNGNVGVFNMDNSVSVDTEAGEVVLWDVSGSALVDVAEGSIAASLELPARGKAQLSVGEGPIWLGIPTDTSAKLTAQSSEGVISVEVLEIADVSSTCNALEATLGTGEASISLDASENISLTGY